MKILLFLLSVASLLFAQKSVIVTDNFEFCDLDTIIEYYEDKTGELSIENIENDVRDDKFRSLGQFSNFGFSESSFWVRFKITNIRSDNTLPFLAVTVNNTEIDYIDFYQIGEDGAIVKELHTGNMLPIESRQQPETTFRFLAFIPKNQTHLIYFRIKTDTPIKLSFSLMSMRQYLKKNNMRLLLSGLFIGMLLLAIAYYSILFFRIKDRSFIWLSLAVIALLFSFLISSGFAYLYIWPNHSFWNKLAVPVSDALLLILFIRFVIEFLELKKYLFLWYKIFQIVLVSLLVLIGLVLFVDFFIVKQLIYLGMMIAMILMIPVSFLSLREGYKPAKFFFIGLLFLVPASLYYLLMEFGIIPLNSVGETGYLISSIFLIWFFSQAVSERVNILRSEKDSMEGELLKNEKRFSLIIDAAELGIWDWDLKKNKVIRNDRWSVLLGYGDSGADYSPDSWKRMIHPDDRQLVQERLDAHLRGELESYEVEYRIRHKTGRWIWVMGRGRIVEYDKSGKVSRVAGVIVDITKRKRAETAREVIFNITRAVSVAENLQVFYKTIHQELNKLIDAKNIQVGFYDIENEVVRSPYIVDEKDDYPVFPYKKTRSGYILKTKKAVLFKPKDEKILIDKGELELLKPPTKAWMGAPLIVKDNVVGLIFVQSYENENVYDEDDLLILDFVANQIASSVAFKRAVQDVRENERRYKTLFNTASAAIMIMKDGVFVDCNEITLKMFACTKEEIIGSPPDKFSPDFQPDGRASKEKAMEKINAALAGNPQLFEWKHLRCDNTQFDAEVDLSLVELSEEKHIQVIVRDISTRKRTERLLRVINEAGRAMQNALSSADIFEKISAVLNKYNYLFAYLSYDDKRRVFRFEYINLNEKMRKKIERMIGYRLAEMEFSVNLHQSFVRVVEDKDIVYLEKGDNVLGKIFSDSYADLQRMIGREVIGDLSIILAPLIEADRIEGMIMFESAELIESDISTINIFVQQLTYALKRAQHFEQAQREIAVRMEVEKALRASEDKFSKSFYLSPNAVSISFAETGELIDVNQGFLDIFGYERSEVIGKTITEIALWKNKDDREKMVRMLQKDGSVRNFESQGITKSGKVFLGNISAELIEIDGEEYVLVVFDDITERKKAENALRESEEKFRLYMENAHDGIMVFGSDYRFEYVNKEFCKICGYPYEEVIVKRITDFLDEGAKKKILNQYDNRRKEKSSVSRFVFPIIRKNGEKRMVEISSAVIEDSKGDLKTIAHLLDVTERFQLQEQLNQSQKMEAIGQLAGGVAHDFNNLLTVISGYSNLLLMESRLNKDTKEKIEQIQRAAGRAEVLTRQLLAFSRKQIIQPKVVCINMIIRDSLKMIDRIIGEDIRVDLKLSDDLPSILADPHQVEQILINLVVNARDAVYVHPDSFARKLITIETKSVYLDDQFLKTHTDVNAGSYIEFSVSDTGIGMDREMTKKIFEPFFTTKDKSKGTGLGLSTVYGIVKQNKGTVNVYSELGRGTTLKVYWPAVENVSETQEEEKNTALQKGSEVVLLVEDDEDVRNFSAEAIRSFGYRIYVANNAKEALDMIKNDGIVPDLLITDIIMPEMNGKELSEEIKKALPDIKILFTSGYPDNHILSKGFIEAGVHFLEKPFSLDALSAKIRDVINAGNV